MDRSDLASGLTPQPGHPTAQLLTWPNKPHREKVVFVVKAYGKSLFQLFLVGLKLKLYQILQEKILQPF